MDSEQPPSSASTSSTALLNTLASSPPPLPPAPRVKSPPLAFERTPNDVLLSNQSNTYAAALASPPIPAMAPRSPRSPPFQERQLQAIIDQQHHALRKARASFEEERKAWDLERRHLQQRIACLEQHIKPGDHWSPAKSPIMSPSTNAALVSPNTRPSGNNSLPTIAEDEDIQPLSARRANAPASIQLPSTGPITGDGSRRKSSVTFTNADGLFIEEIAVSPSHAELSPLPPNNRVLAGHTPVRAPQRPPTPPPQKMSMDGIEDTPTRNNTHINAFLTQRGGEEDGDHELKGPLMMPELPNQPHETNFTLDALSKKLEHIHEHPEDGKPMIFNEPSPGMVSPASEKEDELSPLSKPRDASSRAVHDSPQLARPTNSTSVPDPEAPLAPVATRASEFPPSDLSPNALSPSVSNGGVISPQEAHEAKIQAEFEQGGIRLKKKTSVNFGAPFGSLNFPGSRTLSQDRS